MNRAIQLYHTLLNTTYVDVNQDLDLMFFRHALQLDSYFSVC